MRARNRAVGVACAGALAIGGMVLVAAPASASEVSPIIYSCSSVTTMGIETMHNSYAQPYTTYQYWNVNNIITTHYSNLTVFYATQQNLQRVTFSAHSDAGGLFVNKALCNVAYNYQ